MSSEKVEFQDDNELHGEHGKFCETMEGDVSGGNPIAKELAEMEKILAELKVHHLKFKEGPSATLRTAVKEFIADITTAARNKEIPERVANRAIREAQRKLRNWSKLE